MLIARQIAHALSALCPGLSVEATAVALGIQLTPLPRVRYRYLSKPEPRVEYDCLATPAEQERWLQRAVVLRCLDTLKLAAGTPSLADITDEVFGYALPRSAARSASVETEPTPAATASVAAR
jgi:hypothetical protein